MLYAARVPERWYPRCSNIVGSSHQLMHMSAICGAMCYAVGILTANEYWKGTNCMTLQQVSQCRCRHMFLAVACFCGVRCQVGKNGAATRQILSPFEVAPIFFSSQRTSMSCGNIQVVYCSDFVVTILTTCCVESLRCSSGYGGLLDRGTPQDPTWWQRWLTIAARGRFLRGRGSTDSTVSTIVETTHSCNIFIIFPEMLHSHAGLHLFEHATTLSPGYSLRCRGSTNCH
jgi:hypothetical protein